MNSKKSELRLLIKEENKEVLQLIADNMSGASLTSALNYVLETVAWTALDDLKTLKERRRSNVGYQQTIVGHQQTIAVPSRTNAERQVYVPELDGNAVESAFD